MSAKDLLDRLDALPTPSPLAMRLLQATVDDASDARELVAIIRDDAALTARILSLCRRGPRGRALDVASLDRAVVLLGFGAVRSAALAVEFVSTLGGPSGRAAGFDPLRYWRHCLAKALVAEGLARRIPGLGKDGRGFVLGLLHDLGALVLHRVAPALFDAACDDAERSGTSLDACCRHRLGLSIAEAGSRVAARWSLPEEVRYALELRGEAALVAPEPQRPAVLVAELADRLVRTRHVGGAGFGPLRLQGEGDPSSIAGPLGFDAAALEASLTNLFEEVALRSEALGLAATTSAALAEEALDRAQRRLARPGNPGADPRSESPDLLAELDAAGDWVSTLGAVARLVNRWSGRSDRLLVVSAPVDGDRAELREYGPDGTLIASRIAGEGDRDGRRAAARWCELRAGGAPAGRLAFTLRGTTLATYHRAEGEAMTQARLATAPIGLCAFALGAALDRERFRRAQVRLAEAARVREVLRERVLDDRLRAAAFQTAAGLAHELNNPLCIVSGRAQLLRPLVPGAATGHCDEIVDAAERASAIVGELLRTLRPRPPAVVDCDASEIVEAALLRLAEPAQIDRIAVRGGAAHGARLRCSADPAQAAEALAEALENALHAAPQGRIDLSAEIDPGDGRCLLSVRDSGPGFSAAAIRHAFDPFFSDRPSGRGAGLGLTRARALVEASGGSIELRNVSGGTVGEGGAIVTIALPAESSGRTDGRGERRADQAPLGEAA